MKSNRTLAISLVALVLGMVMLAYASVPLYRLFCQVTGFGGTTGEALAAPEKIIDRTITVRFDAQTDRELPWEFKPETPHVTVKLGEQKTIYYIAKNLAAYPTTGHSTFNVTPHKVGQYFVKTQCFCFEDQTLKPGESVRMGATFYVDPKLQDDKNAQEVDTITLSYTFFASKSGN